MVHDCAADQQRVRTGLAHPADVRRRGNAAFGDQRHVLGRLGCHRLEGFEVDLEFRQVAVVHADDLRAGLECGLEFVGVVDLDEGLEAAFAGGGSSLEIDEAEGLAPNSATLSTGTDGVLHGAMTKLLQSNEGQIMESHSVSAGLDYAGVGPELSYLVDSGRVTPVNVDDETALNAFHRLSNLEGIIPALESSHALGYVECAAGTAAEESSGQSPREENYEDLGDLIVVNVSGRGDKDLETVLEETEKRDLEAAPEVEVFDR